jgi:hypothetical protein
MDLVDMIFTPLSIIYTSRYCTSHTYIDTIAYPTLSAQVIYTSLVTVMSFKKTANTNTGLVYKNLKTPNTRTGLPQ